MLIYKCSCGCTRAKDKMVEHKKLKWVCPEHEDGVIVERFIYCIEKNCGAKRYFNSATAGHNTIRCVECQKEFNARTMAQWQKENTQGKGSKKRYAKEADIEKRGSCAGEYDCIIKYDYYYDIPCKNCLKFTKKDFSTSAYNTRRDYSVRSRHGDIVFI